MGVNSLPKTVTRQRRGCDLNPDPSAPESSTLSTRLPSHPLVTGTQDKIMRRKRRLVCRRYGEDSDTNINIHADDNDASTARLLLLLLRHMHR